MTVSACMSKRHLREMTADFEGYIFLIKWFVRFVLWKVNLSQISQSENECVCWRKI